MRLPENLYYLWSYVDLNDYLDYITKKRKGISQGKTYTDQDLDALFRQGEQ